MIWIETPTNPTLRLVDIARTAEFARQRGILTVVDNTFASPWIQRPLELGADIVDALGDQVSERPLRHGRRRRGHGECGAGREESGSCRTRSVRLPAVRQLPRAAGIEDARVAHASGERERFAYRGWLEKHPRVARVFYPGLPSHPQHELAKQQMKNGYSGIVTFFVKGGVEESRRMLERCRVFTLAESLGGVESLVDHPGLMTHASIPPDKRQALGIDDSLIRLSVGIEDVEDLVADLQDALSV